MVQAVRTRPLASPFEKAPLSRAFSCEVALTAFNRVSIYQAPTKPHRLAGRQSPLRPTRAEHYGLRWPPRVGCRFLRSCSSIHPTICLKTAGHGARLKHRSVIEALIMMSASKPESYLSLRIETIDLARPGIIAVGLGAISVHVPGFDHSTLFAQPMG